MRAGRGLGGLGLAVTLLLAVACTPGAREDRRQWARGGVVIDTDAGPDDLMAIALLLGHPAARVRAVTVVQGLTRVEAGASNVLRLLELLGADSVVVYAGAATHLQPTAPFPKEWTDAAERAGAQDLPEPLRGPAERAAADFLADVLASRDTAVTILALGPLTNLALALRRAGADAVPPLRTVVMGGAIGVPGNLANGGAFRTDNTVAEWNFFSDPLAAREVIASRLRIEMIPLDATNRVPIDSCFVRALWEGEDTPVRRYVLRLLDGAREWIDRGLYYAWDPLAAASVVDPAVVTLSTLPLRVEVDSPVAGWSRPWEKGREVRAALDASPCRFAATFDLALGTTKARRGAARGGAYFCPSP